jgi:Pyruvate/2-oxoacid:ferredoxin oxidoreductase delta subunit
MAQRKIVRIDEEKCNGCGLCVPSCAEGAIQIVDGKARLVADVYCDGLGACLGECPEGAITIIEREAVPFDEEAAREHVERLRAQAASAERSGGCPGAAVRNLQLDLVPPGPAPRSTEAESSESEPSALGNWPVQLHLVPPDAPFLQDADLLLVADCVPFALADFHRRLLRGRPVVIGCPKLDDAQSYVEKLAAMLTLSSVNSLTVVHMEVPCCTGLARIAEAALRASGRDIPLEAVTISIRGKMLNRGGS